MAIIHEGFAPYAPASQVLRAIGHYREKGATQFSKELLMKLGAPAAYANRTMAALKALDLVDDEGTPTAAFTELQRANESEYRPRLEQIIRTAYDEVFQVVDPATESSQAIMDAFRFYQPVAQRDKMVTLFLALCEEAGIVPREKAPRKRSRIPKEHPKRLPGMATPSGRVRTAPAAPTAPIVTPIAPQTPSQTFHPLIQGLLDVLPPQGGVFTEQQQADWLDGWKVAFKFLYKPGVKEPATPSAEGKD
jgi:hypothetical protein